MNVNMVASASVVVHHALEETPVVSVAEYHAGDGDRRMIGSVYGARLVPVIDSDDAGRTRIDGSDCEPAHPGEQVDEGDGLHASPRAV